MSILMVALVIHAMIGNQPELLINGSMVPPTKTSHDWFAQFVLHIFMLAGLEGLGWERVGLSLRRSKITRTAMNGQVGEWSLFSPFSQQAKNRLTAQGRMRVIGPHATKKLEEHEVIREGENVDSRDALESSVLVPKDRGYGAVAVTVA